MVSLFLSARSMLRPRSLVASPSRRKTAAPGARSSAASLLLAIDKRDYDLEVTRLEEELKQADAMLDELKQEIDNLNNQIDLSQRQLEIDKRELERNVSLAASGALSESEVDRARRAELATRNAFQTLADQKTLFNRRQVRLQAARDLGQAQLDKAKLALARTEIRAPLDGVVVSESVEQDGYVQMGSTVVTLQDTSRLDVTCKLHMHQMHWLWQGGTAEGTARCGGSRNRARRRVLARLRFSRDASNGDLPHWEYVFPVEGAVESL